MKDELCHKNDEKVSKECRNGLKRKEVNEKEYEGEIIIERKQRK